MKNLTTGGKIAVGIIAAIFLSVIITLCVLYSNGTIRYVNPVKSTEGKYLMCYFTGNGENEERIHIALSSDGVNFNAINNDEPIITQNQGTGGARDPYIFRAQDGTFYIVATDMKAEQGWTSNHALTIWHSVDLVTWSDEFNLDIRSFRGFESCNRAWAPQVIWNPATHSYMLYFAISTEKEGETNPELYYCLTKNFKSFSEPQLLYKREGVPCIDGDIVFNKANNKYYLYFKYDELQKIAYVTSDSPTGPYTDEPVIVSYYKGVEGSQMYNINSTDTWIMVMDSYFKGEFLALQTDDFEHFSKIKKKKYNYTNTPRHGSVMSITDLEYTKLVAAYGFEFEQENHIITPF